MVKLLNYLFNNSQLTTHNSPVFLSCDWGTSVFRLRLVDSSNFAIKAEQKNEQGIAKTYELWTRQKNKDNRWDFYLSVIKEQVKFIEKKADLNLNDVPLTISGMASSSIGMMDLPYKELPFSLDGSDLSIRIIVKSENFPHDILIISGAKTEDDVMRGEETKLIGSVTDRDKDESIFIFPGTHTKHVFIKNGKAQSFQTFMTGELFDLLSGKSILSDSVEKGDGLNDPESVNSFKKGVMAGKGTNLLHACFLVRTNHLFNRLNKKENYFYLSGLLIGCELNELSKNQKNKIVLVSSTSLEPYYRMALEIQTGKNKMSFETRSADEALIQGQMKMAKIFLKGIKTF